MMGHDDDAGRGVWLAEQDWIAICEKAGLRLRCPFCCDFPEVEDAEFFLEEDCCPHCFAVFKRMMRD